MTFEEDILQWLSKNNEFTFEKFLKFFNLEKEKGEPLLKLLQEKQIILDVSMDTGIKYMITDNFIHFKNKAISAVAPQLKELLKEVKYTSKTEESSLNSWNQLWEIDKFVIFDGAERIYDIYINGKKIRMEGKEIIDYNIFRLRFFEVFGILLDTYRGIVSDWATLVTHWHNKYGDIQQQKTENLSDIQEAKDLVIDYINNATISDNHLVKEGIVCVKENRVYVPTKFIKKMIKKYDLKVYLRKLAYILDDYLISGSLPLKIENKSERFWVFDKSRFNLNEKDKLQIEEGEDE